MAKYKSYSEKLKDPRWQKKRLEILQRDNFTCECFGEKEKTLHVHHFHYIQGIEPWEYNNLELMTLCNECHEMLHNILNLGFDIYVLYNLLDLYTTTDHNIAVSGIRN